MSLTGFSYDNIANQDRFTWELYNQARYQLTQQTVLTGDYRYAQTLAGGIASDATDHYLLAGIEQRFSPNTIGILRAGVQLHDQTGGSNNSSPYLELAVNSQVNEQFRVKLFTRYGIENYDTVQVVSSGLADYGDRRTLRVGVSGDYTLSSKLTLFSGVDYIPTSYQGGRDITNQPPVSIANANEEIFNAYIGMSMKITDYLTGTATYNYTNASSDFAGASYSRNRISLGLSTQF
jgi:hypothetical protein